MRVPKWFRKKSKPIPEIPLQLTESVVKEYRRLFEKQMERENRTKMHDSQTSEEIDNISREVFKLAGMKYAPYRIDLDAKTLYIRMEK